MVTAEVAVRQLDQADVAELDRVAEIRQRVLVAPLPLDLAGQLQEARRLPDEVERDVGERDVLLEDRPVPAPLRQPVPEHQPIIAEPEQVLEQRSRAPTQPHRRRAPPATARRASPSRHSTRTPRGIL